MTPSTFSAEPPTPAGEGRLHALDLLRAVVILLVILLHASITYMASPPSWWYVIEPRNSIVFTAIVLLLDVPLMQILFFIAGFFAYPSLERSGAGRFLRGKAVRIGLPWIFGVVFLAPLASYLIPLTRGVARPYWVFWAYDFWGPYFQQAVYWFLGILLLLFALLAALYAGEPSLKGVRRQARPPRLRQFVMFLALTTIWYFASSAVTSPDYWSTSLKLFVFQPVRLMLYAGYFGLGVYADRRGWLRVQGYQPGLAGWSIALLVSGMLYLGWHLILPDGAGVLMLAVPATLFNVYCLSALLTGVAFFQRYVNRPTRVGASLARNAYAIYYVHPLILYPAAYAARSVQASIFLEVACLFAFTALVSWGLGAFVLTRLPGLRDIF